MVKCPACQKNKGGVQLTCRECKIAFCIGCIQLEIHKCACLESRTTFEKNLLEKKLVKIESSRIIKF